MKRKGIIMAAALLLAVQANAGEMPELKTDKDKLSYSIGASIGKNFRKEGSDVDLDLMFKGIKDGLAGNKLLLPERELRMVMNAYQSEVRRNAMVARRQAIEQNRKKGEAFLAENKTKPGVVTLPDGVQYLVVKQGKGKKPTGIDTVEVHYRGMLLDGSEFDASPEGHTSALKMEVLIPGLKEAVKLMPVGSSWKIYVPSQLAYGQRGVGADIGPNEALIFEMELIAIK